MSEHSKIRVFDEKSFEFRVENAESDPVIVAIFNETQDQRIVVTPEILQAYPYDPSKHEDWFNSVIDLLSYNEAKGLYFMAYSRPDNTESKESCDTEANPETQAVHVHQASSARFSGWLMRKRSSNAWQTLFFLLYRGKLKAYRLTCLKGSVSLVGAVIDPVIDNPNHSHVFGITAGGSRGKLMQLSAVTAREKSMWINALREAVEEANKQFAEPPQTNVRRRAVQPGSSSFMVWVDQSPLSSFSAVHPKCTEGVLFKKAVSAVINKNWNKRFFRLDKQRKELLYFDYVIEEDVDLRTGADFQVQIASPDEATPHDKEPSIEFVLKSGLTELLLRAPNAHERDMWIEALSIENSTDHLIQEKINTRVDESNVIANEWMNKQGEHAFSQWKRRFFVLTDRPRILYFSSEVIWQQPPIGSIELSEATHVQAISSYDPHFPAKYRLEIVTPSRTWILCPDGQSQENVDRWAHLIQQAMESPAETKPNNVSFKKKKPEEKHVSRQAKVVGYEEEDDDDEAELFEEQTELTTWQRISGNAPSSSMSPSPWIAAILANRLLMSE